MIFGSVCSGIEAASVAWEPLGWRAAFYSEIDRFPSAVLEHRFPAVTNLGDMNRFGEWPDAAIDLLVGGTPCQSFSVAGLRGGMADPRGNLALVYLALAARYRPRWVVWENVPGVLSSGGGRDFGSFLGGLVELGYGFAYRVLDAQHFGVPQRRRRVFVVGHLGDWRRAAEVLFEPSSLRRHSAPRREAGERLAPSLASRTRGGGRLGTDAELDGALIAHQLTARHDSSEDGCGRGTPLVSMSLNAHGGRIDGESETFIPIPFDTTQITSAQNRNNPKPGDPSHPLAAGAHAPAIAFGSQMSTPHWQIDQADTLQAKNPKGVAVGAAVRRLTPRECERLQGFPDDWTLIPYRGRAAADGPRYKALGNSMAVPVMAWLGRRIEQSESSRKELAA